MLRELISSQKKHFCYRKQSLATNSFIEVGVFLLINLFIPQSSQLNKIF